MLGGTCSACKIPLAQHPRSIYGPRPQTPDLVVCRGRCILDGVGAPQKICWSLADAPLTVLDYLAAVAVSPPALGPCPVCGGVLWRHGLFWRYLLEAGADLPVRVPIYRGRCPAKLCPIVTVSFFPSFVTPLVRSETAVRERVLRGHDESTAPLERLAEHAKVSLDTARRWVRAFRPRSDALHRLLLVTCLLFSIDASFALPDGATVWQAADHVRRLLDRDACLPALTLSRLDIAPRAPPAGWPVWA